MNHRPHRRRANQYDAGKSSFCASPQLDSLAQDLPSVKNAIDDSLYAVRFNAQDMRAVLKSAKTGKKQTAAKRSRRFKPDLIFACALALIIALPISLHTIESRKNITTIVTAPGDATPQPAISSQPDADIVTPMPSILSEVEAIDAANASISESEAIRAARDCYNAQCDTTIFTFEEFEVGVVFSAGDDPQYIVTMESIYKNGCSFTVILSAVSGEILQYSTPQLATVPAYIDNESPEVRAWFDKYGEQLLAWPQDVQAEFSRRYEGGTLRAARADELSYEDALSAVMDVVTSEAPDLFTAFYPVLYSERASSSGRAYYMVYCYAQDINNVTEAGEPMIVSFDAQTGEILSIAGNPLEHSLGFETVLPSK